MGTVIEKIKSLSHENLVTIAKLSGGMALLMVFALFAQNYFSLYGHASSAAAIYWQQQTGWGTGTGYPSPGYTTACIWDNSTAQVAGGEQDANCYWNPVTAVLDAQPVGGSGGQVAYAQYWCSTQASDHSCSTYTATQGTTLPLLVNASSQVQLDWACQPGQKSIVYDASGNKYVYPSAIATTTYATANSASISNSVLTNGPLSGSTVVTAPASGSTTYKLTCSGGTGGPYTASVMVTAENITISNNALSFGSTPNTVPSGTQATVSWSSSGLKTASCTLAGPTVSTSTPNITPPTNWTNISSGYNDSSTTLSSLLAQTVAVGSTTDYLLGGYLSNGGAVTTWPNQTAVYYAPAANPTGWQDTGGRLPSFAYAQSAVVGNTIYLFGGLNYPTSSYSSAIYSAPVSNPAAWTNTGQHLPVALAESALYKDGTNLYLFGGQTSSVSTANIYKAPISNPTLWTATPIGALPTAPSYQPILVKGGAYIYLIYTGSSRAALPIYRALISNLSLGSSAWSSVGTATVYPGTPAYVDTTNNYMYVYGVQNPSGGNFLIQRAPLSTNMTTWTTVGTMTNYNNYLTIFQTPNNNVYQIGSGYEFTLNPTASTTLWTPTETVLPYPINSNTLYTVGSNYYATAATGPGILLTAPTSNPTNWSVVNQTYQQYSLSSDWETGGPWTENVTPQTPVFSSGNDLYSFVQTQNNEQPYGYNVTQVIAASSSSPTSWKLLPGQVGAGPTSFGAVQNSNGWYAIGGQVAAINATSNVLHSSDSTPQSWPVAGATAVIADFPTVTDTTHNIVYTLGGWTGGGANFTNAVYSSPLSNLTTWSNAGTLPVVLEGAEAGIFSDSSGIKHVYVFGGITTGGYASQTIYQSIALTGGLLTPWTNVGTLPASAYNAPLVTYGNTAYILGAGSGDLSILTAPLTDTNNGSVVTIPLTQTTTYTLSCLDNQGNAVSTSTTIYVNAAPPALSITACNTAGTSCNSATSSTPAYVPTGQATNISWSASNVNSCTVSDTLGTYSANTTSSATTTAHSSTTGPDTYTLQCLLPGGGSAEAGATVNLAQSCQSGVGTAPNSCSSQCVIDSATSSIVFGSPVTMSWCCPAGSASGSASTGGGTFTPSGSSGSQSVTPTQSGTATYTLSCPSGSGTASVNAQTAPTLASQLLASPSRVRKNSPSILSWSVTGLTAGTSCSLSSSASPTPVNIWNGVGTSYASPVGGWTTSPITQATTFKLACTNAAGTTNSSVTVGLVPTVQEI